MYPATRHMRSLLWKRRPIQLTFFLTRACNANCPFCFYLRSTDSALRTDPELSLEEIEKISASLGNLLWLAFSGGEIFLRHDLVEISRIFYVRNKPVIMLFPTNGLLPERIRNMTENILQECRKSVIAVKLSIDGIGSLHDALRNTPGSFNRTLETYHLLEPLLRTYPNFELGVNTIMCSENHDEMDGIIDFVGELKSIGTHTISLVRGDLTERHYREVDPEKYLHAVERLGAESRRREQTYRFKGARLKAAQDVLQRRLIHRTMREQTRQIPCYAGKLNLVLTECGEIYPCEILRESFGNVRDLGYDLGRIIRSEKANTLLQSISKGQCFCTHECYFMTNILLNPRLYPKLAWEYLKM